MKVNEIFESIQGEGKYIGYPCLFIRLSGCTRQCDFCDTKYHTKGVEMSINKIISTINKSKMKFIVWTGGEPMLQIEEIFKVYSCTIDLGIEFHLETNGDILDKRDFIFDYICFSPKDFKTANFLNILTQNRNTDIKVVTDLKLNKDLIPYATMLMPLTTYDEEKDKKIQQDVWNYCVENKIRYAPRMHVSVWGKQKGI